MSSPWRPVAVYGYMLLGVYCSLAVYTEGSDWWWAHALVMCGCVGVVGVCMAQVAGGAAAEQWAGEGEKCDKCSLVRRERTHHCGACGGCTVGYDHHCLVLSSCVGVPNFKAFFLFLCYTSGLIVHFLITVGVHALPAAHPSPLTPARFFFGIFTTAYAFTASCFLIYVTDMVSTCLEVMRRNRTQHEAKYDLKESYDLGNVWDNLEVFLGRPTWRWVVPCSAQV